MNTNYCMLYASVNVAEGGGGIETGGVLIAVNKIRNSSVFLPLKAELK